MVTLIGLSGSLRQGSFNSALLRSAAELVPAGAALRIATIRGIPLYDADVETSEGIPAAVAALKDGIASADGLLLATPEYNHLHLVRLHTPKETDRWLETVPPAA